MSPNSFVTLPMFHHHPPTTSAIKPVQTTSRRAAGEIPWNQTTSKWRSWGNANDDDITHLDEKSKRNNLGNRKSDLDSPSNLKKEFENLDLISRDSIHDESKTKVNSQSTAQSEKTNDTVTMSSENFPSSSQISLSSPTKENSTLDLSISSNLQDIIIGRESNQVSEDLTDEEKELRRQAMAKEQQQRILQQVEEMRRRKQRVVKPQGPLILDSKKCDSTLPFSASIHKTTREKSDSHEHDEELRKYQRERSPRTKGLLYRRCPGGNLIQVDRSGDPLKESHQLQQSDDAEADDEDDDNDVCVETPNVVPKEITSAKQESKVKSSSLNVRNVPITKKVSATSFDTKHNPVKSFDNKLKNRVSKNNISYDAEISKKIDQNSATATNRPRNSKRV